MEKQVTPQKTSKQATFPKNKKADSFLKEKTLVELYMFANGAGKEISSDFKVVHHGEIDKIPPKGWEKYSPQIKKKRYIDSSESLIPDKTRMLHDLEEK